MSAITNKLISLIALKARTDFLENIADIYQPQTIPTSQLKDDEKYFVYGANGIIGRYSKYNHENPQICITCRGNTCGTLNFTIAKSWITGNAMVVNTDSCSSVNKRYLYHYLSTINFAPLISGSGQPQIVRTPLAKLKVPIPDLCEQNKIVDIIDTIEEKIQLEQTVLSDLQQQKQYLLNNMFI